MARSTRKSILLRIARSSCRAFVRANPPAILAVLLCVAGPTRAQEPDPPERDAHLGVYLDDSFKVRQELRAIERLEVAGHWTRAALRLHNLADRNGAQVVEREPGLYTSVTQYLDERVSDWPDAGLNAYRELYEKEAAALFETARADGDFPGLFRVLNGYFPTTAAGQAGYLLAQFRLEAGRFEASAALLDRLLELHRDFDDLPLRAMLLNVAASQWSGRIERARKLADQVRARHPRRLLLWAGTEQPVEEVIEDILNEPLIPAGRGDPPDLWAAFGGNPARNHVIDSTATVGAAIWSFVLAEGETTVDHDAEPVASEQSVSRGRHINLFPAVRGHRVFVHDGSRAWALDLETGGVLWDRKISEILRNQDDSGPPALYAPALWKNRVIISLGSNDVPYYGSTTAVSRASLICLDADTGRQLWNVDGRDLSPPFTTVQFDGAPVCADERILMVARRRKTFGFEDCLLYCFDVRTGRLSWQTHLGSASAGGYGYRKPTFSAPAVSGDTVFVQSNLGTLAAVDLQSGLLRWMRVYQGRGKASAGWATQVSSWQYNPTMIWKDRVVIAPLDRDEVLVLDRATGHIVTEISSADLDNAQTLLGIREDRLYFLGNHLGAWDLVENRKVWSEPLPDPGLFGRGTVVNDAIFVPTAGYLFRYSLDGELLERAAWNPLQARGNIVATPGELLVASSERITCFAQKQDAIARLRTRMELALDDPRPALDLAEMAFRTGEYDLGIEVLGKSIARTGGLFDLADADLKERIFRDCLAFADRLLRDSISYQPQALELYKLAAQCPPDARGAVLYRLRMAELHRRMEHFTDAIALYRQIIADRSLRELSLPSTWHTNLAPGQPNAASFKQDGPTRQGGDVAKRLIARLIRKHGRQVYAPFEAQARELLDRGVSLAEPALLERVTDSFPNAEAAPRARVALGDLWMDKHRYHLAVRSYKMAKNLYLDRIDLPTLHEKIILCYLRDSRMRAAADWLRSAAWQFPRHLVRLGDESITFARWRDRTFANTADAGPTMPQVVPPLAQAHTRQFEGTELRILEPLFDQEPGTPRDVYLAYYRDKLMLFDPVRNVPLWERPADCKAEPQLLAFLRVPGQGNLPEDQAGQTAATDSRMVLATRYEVFALDPRTSRRIWGFGRHPAGLEDPNADHENFTVFKNHVLYGTRLVSIRGSGASVCHDVFTGRELWITALEHAPSENAADLNDEYFLYHALSGGQHLYPLIDAVTGALVHVFDPGNEAGPPLAVALLPEGIALVITARNIRAWDLGSFKQLWQTEHDQSNLQATIQIGLDVLYLSRDQRHVIRQSLYEDRLLGRSAPLDPDSRSLQGMAAQLRGDTLFVTSDNSVTALDAADLRFMWEGTRDESTEFVRHEPTSRFLVSIARSTDEPTMHSVYFYDRRNRSGRLAEAGGILQLGAFEHLRGIHLRDHCLLVVEGNIVLTWVEEAAWPK